MHSFLQRFLADRSGNILILTGLGFLFLVGIGGAGHDLGKQQLVKQRIQQASDAASIAAAGMDFGTSDAHRTLMAQNIYNLNYPDLYLGIPRPAPSIVITAVDIRVSGTADFNTSFVGNLGVPTLTSAATSRTQLRKPPTPIDLILVMDASLSMNDPSVTGPWRDPVRDDTVTWLAQCRIDHRNYYVSYYTDWCAIPANYLIYGPSPAVCLTAVMGFWDAATPTPYETHCNTALSDGMTPGRPSRMNALRATAMNAATELLKPPNTLNHRVATITWSDFLNSSNSFSNDLTTVSNNLLAILPNGNTDSTVGLAQAESYMASVSPSAVPVVILLTDGANHPADKMIERNANSVTICNRLKAVPKTLVFTIAFGDIAVTGTDAPTISQFLSDCATGPNGPTQPNKNIFYFPAPDGAALNAAFTSIIETIRKVQIKE